MFAALKQKFFGPRHRTSKSVARSRLHFVLVQDRTGLSGDEMANFKKELVQVIQKYFVIDKQAFDIDYRRQGDTTTLLINSPVIVRRQEGGSDGVGAEGARQRRRALQAAADTSEPEDVPQPA